MMRKDTEAAELLAGLRRVREESLRVSEYCTALSLSADLRRRDQALKATLEWHAERGDRLLVQLERRIGSELRDFVLATLRAWLLVVRRFRANRPGETILAVRRLAIRCMLGWCRYVFEQHWEELLDRWRQEVSVAESESETKVAGARAHVASVHQRSVFVRLQLAMTIVSNRLRHHSFHTWACSTAQAARRRGQVSRCVSLILLLGDAHRTSICIQRWRTFAISERERRGDLDYQVKIERVTGCTLMLIFGTDPERQSRLVLRAWRIEAIWENQVRAGEMGLAAAKLKVEDLQHGTHVFQKLLLRWRALISLGDGACIQEHLGVWISFYQRRCARLEEEKLLARTQLTLQTQHLSEEACTRCCGTLEALLVELWLQLCFAWWYQTYTLSRRETIRRADIECRAFRDSVHAWTTRSWEFELQRLLGSLVAILRARSNARLRGALQHWKAGCPENNVSARSTIEGEMLQELRAARLEHAKVSAERRALEGSMAAEYLELAKRQAAAKQCLDVWTAAQCETVVRLSMTHWWLAATLRRVVVDQVAWCARATTLGSSLHSGYEAALKAHRSLAARILGRRLVLVVLGLSFHSWRLHARRLAHEAWMLQSAEAAEERRRLCGRDDFGRWLAHVAAHLLRVRLGVSIRESLDAADLLLSILWEWKYIFFATTFKVGFCRRVWHLLCNGRIFGARPWLLLACIVSWRILGKLEAAEVEGHEIGMHTWLETLHGQAQAHHVRTIGDLFEWRRTGLILRSAMRLWGRLHAECLVDKAALRIQGQWTKQERECRLQLNAMAERSHACELFARRQMEVAQTIHTMRLTTIAWRQVCQGERLKAELVGFETSAREALVAQQRFEDVACERWTDMCFSSLRHAEDSEMVLSCLCSWRWEAAQSRRWLKRQGITSSLLSTLEPRAALDARAAHSRVSSAFARGCLRASRVAEVAMTRRRASTAKVFFVGWHSGLFQTRRHRLKRRCKRLEAAAARRGIVLLSGSAAMAPRESQSRQVQMTVAATDQISSSIKLNLTPERSHEDSESVATSPPMPANLFAFDPQPQTSSSELRLPRASSQRFPSDRIGDYARAHARMATGKFAAGRMGTLAADLFGQDVQSQPLPQVDRSRSHVHYSTPLAGLGATASHGGKRGESFVEVAPIAANLFSREAHPLLPPQADNPQTLGGNPTSHLRPALVANLGGGAWVGSGYSNPTPLVPAPSLSPPSEPYSRTVQNIAVPVAVTRSSAEEGSEVHFANRLQEFSFGMRAGR